MGAQDQFGDWLEAYTTIMELNYWGSSTAKSAKFNEATQTWVVEVEREGEMVVLKPQHVVLALGISGNPNVSSGGGGGEASHIGFLETSCPTLRDLSLGAMKASQDSKARFTVAIHQGPDADAADSKA